MVMQNQFGRAESRTDGALKLHCPMSPLTGCSESLAAIVLKTESCVSASDFRP